MTVYVVIREESFPGYFLETKIVSVCLNKAATAKYMKKENYVSYYTIEKTVDETNS